MRRWLESVFCAVATSLTVVSGCQADSRWHCRSDTVSEWTILPDGSSASRQESLVNRFDVDLMGGDSFASLISKTYGEQSIDLRNFVADCAAHSQDVKCDSFITSHPPTQSKFCSFLVTVHIPPPLQPARAMRSRSPSEKGSKRQQF
jgi:hypothetical protein